MSAVSRLALCLALSGSFALTASPASNVASKAASTEHVSALQKGREAMEKAMEAELKRNLQGLKLPGLQNPCMLSCRLRDTRVLTIEASLGALVKSQLEGRRLSDADVWVGSFEKNQMHFMEFSSLMGDRKQDQTPMEDHEAALRCALWQQFDAKYKANAELLEKKLAILKQQKLPEELAKLPDALRPSAAVTRIDPQPMAMDKAAWEKTARELSRIFQNYPSIQKSSVTLNLHQADDLYQTSEGTKSATPLNFALLRAEFSAQDLNGKPIKDVVSFVARSAEALPSTEDMSKAIENAAAKLEQILGAPAHTDSYSGPVLVEGEALADLLSARLFSPQQEGLLSSRRPLFANAQEASYLEVLVGKSMEERMGKRVMSSAFTLKALPGLEQFEGQPLAGGFAVDAEGVASQEVALIEKGMLKGLLTSQTPTLKSAKSNGHMRHLMPMTGLGRSLPATVLPGVLSLEAEKEASKADLKAALVQAAKNEGLEWAYIIRRLCPAEASQGLRIGAPQDNALPAPLHLYRVSVKDGSEQLVRNAHLGGVSVSSLKHILAASSKRQVQNRFLTPGGMYGNAGCPVSFILPEGLLFEELEIQKPKASPNPELPAVPSPLVALKK